MEEFYDILADKGLAHTINPVKYKRPVFRNQEKVFSFLTDIVRKDKKVLIYGDYDPDGAMCAVGVRDAFKYIGFHNYEVFRYVNRTHALDQKAVLKAIEEKFDYMIVCDTGSSEMDAILKLRYFGIKIVILDHHKTVYKYDDYPDNCAIINTTIENKLAKDDLYKLSAGALTYIVMREFQERIDGTFNKSLSAYATISLFADCIDMSRDLNRSIYYESICLSEMELPVYVRHFFNNNSAFCRRFIEFHFTPKINSLFRGERFDILNSYMLSDDTRTLNVNRILDDVVEIYEKARENVAKCADIIDHREIDNFVIGNLSSVCGYMDDNEFKLQNYTGLVANMLANRYGKTAIVYADNGQSIKGSLRDQFGRDYLTLFQQFCNAQGHPSAFGIHLDYVEFSEFVDYVYRIDKKFFLQSVPNSPIVIAHQYKEPDKGLLRDMALYNEFSGNEIPIALMEKRLVGTITEAHSKYNSSFYTTYKWGDSYIQSPNRLNFGTNMLIKPIKSKDVKLLVYEDGLRR